MSDGCRPARFERGRHAAEGAVAVFGGRGDVMRVARQTVAGHFGVDRGAACLGVFQFLENHDAGALAQHEAVAVGVIGTRGLFRRIVASGGKRPAGREAGKRKRGDRRFRAACDHHVGIAEDDQPCGIADGMRAGRTGRHDGMVRPFQAVPDRHLARDQVDDVAGDEERADAPRAALLQDDARFRRSPRGRRCPSRSSRRSRNALPRSSGSSRNAPAPHRRQRCRRG